MQAGYTIASIFAFGLSLLIGASLPVTLIASIIAGHISIVEIRNFAGELGIAFFFLIAVVRLGRNLWARFRHGTPMLPNDFIESGGWMFGLGMILIWIGNAAAVIAIWFTVQILVSPIDGASPALGYIFAILFFVVGFAFVGSAKLKWEKLSSRNVV